MPVYSFAANGRFSRRDGLAYKLFFVLVCLRCEVLLLPVVC